MFRSWYLPRPRGEPSLPRAEPKGTIRAEREFPLILSATLIGIGADSESSESNVEGHERDVENDMFTRNIDSKY